MTRGTMGLMAVAVGMSVAACSADRESLPAAPDFHTVGPSTTTCDFPHIKSIANKYFIGAQKKRVGTLITQMSQAPAFGDMAKDKGFDIDREIALAVRNNQAGTPSRGSDLTNHLILCMFNPESEADAYPESYPEKPEDFTGALSRSLDGAFEVRGGTGDLTAAVRSRATSFSGVAPPLTSTPPATFTWEFILRDNPAPRRILIYGQPASDATYEWKTVPHNAGFNPSVVVGLCIEAPTHLVTENGSYKPYTDPDYFLLPCSPLARAAEGWNPFRLAKGLFSPSLLWAGAVNPGPGLGATTGGIKSEYGTAEVVVDLTLSAEPQDGTVGDPIPPGGFTVTALSAGQPVPGATVTIQAVENNGATVLLTCRGISELGDTDSCTASADDGVAEFGDLSLNKTGGYRLTVSATVSGRPGIHNEVTSNQFNIRP